MKNALMGTLALVATQITPKLVIYAVVITLIVYFVRLMMSIINEC